MHLRLVLSLFIALGWATLALATPAISVGDNHPLPNTSASQIDFITINYDQLSGGGPMQGETIYVSVADEGNGGGSPPDPGEPFITGLDVLTGTVWSSNNTGPNYSMVVAQLWSADVTTSSGTVNATGPAVTVGINRNGAPAGSTWGLRVFVGAAQLGGPYSSNWSNGTDIGVAFGTSDTASGLNGITGVPDGSFQYAGVPEPSSMVLSLFGAAGLVAVVVRRRRAAA